VSVYQIIENLTTMGLGWYVAGAVGLGAVWLTRRLKGRGR
jgi:hypothetical protein